MEEQATEKQIAYIKRLGGTPKAGLTKRAASALIDSLIKSAPSTDRQLKRLARLAANIPKKLTKVQADELIEKLEGDQPPESWQVEQITLLGGVVPKTRRDAMSLVLRLGETAPSTEQQRQQIQQLGGVLPEGCVYDNAETIIEGLQQDADPEDGKPPTKTQINKIIKLGGDPSKAKNQWRADDYISELEDASEEMESRAEEALEDLYSEFTRDLMTSRKPSRAIMIKALQYGDVRGWGEGWENSLDDNGDDAYERINEAIHAVAADLLKKDSVPIARKTTKASNGKGYLMFVILAVIVICVWYISRSF